MSKRRRIPRQARSRAVYDAILHAAALVLIEQGYNKASTGRIAERAGVSVGSLYQYFGGKDDVFEALTERAIGDVQTAGLSALTTDRPIAQRVVQGLRDGYEALSKYPTLIRHLSAVPGTKFAERIEQMRQQSGATVAMVLEQHREQLTITDPALSARVLVDATEGLLMNLSPDDDPDALAEEGARLLLAYCGIGPEESR